MARVVFAVIVDKDVAGTLAFDDEVTVPSVPRLIAAFRSDAKLVETDTEGVGFGWKWDGTNFTPPAEEA